MKKYTTFVPLVLATFILLGYGFIDAAWTAPSSSNKATSNTAAPIDVSGTAQVKTGGLATGPLSVSGTLGVSGNVLASGYCDLNGNNCFSPSNKVNFGGSFWQSWIYVPSGHSVTQCPNGYVVTGLQTYESNGDWIVDYISALCTRIY